MTIVTNTRSFLGTLYEARKGSSMSLDDYLDACKSDSSLYASVHERLLKAIGDPVIVDTQKDPRLGRIFGNRTIRTYPAFVEFYGMEDVIERVVAFFKKASQGLEERKQ